MSQPASGRRASARLFFVRRLRASVNERYKTEPETQPLGKGGRPRRTRRSGSNIHSNVHGRTTVQQVVLFDLPQAGGTSFAAVRSPLFSLFLSLSLSGYRSPPRLLFTSLPRPYEDSTAGGSPDLPRVGVRPLLLHVFRMSHPVAERRELYCALNLKTTVLLPVAGPLTPIPGGGRFGGGAHAPTPGRPWRTV